MPTTRYLTGLPMPRHAEGAVIYQALEDPEAKFKELDGMKRAYERMKAVRGRHHQRRHVRAHLLRRPQGDGAGV